MATLVLQAAGAALGASLGGPMFAAIGQAAGALAGSMIDRQVLGGGAATRHVEGPRLKTLDGISANEGAPVARVYGRVRVGGQVIWATRFEEQVDVARQGRSGGKSTGSGQSATVTTSYSYFANVAIALCEGPVAMVRRIWADGKELDLTTVTLRLHPGTHGQGADPLILARQGATPAYRDTAYVVFERLPLEPYGNRLPQLSFEVVRPVEGLAQRIRGVDLIPGASEFAYAPDLVSRDLGPGASQPENRNQLTHATDWDASLDAMQAVLPAVGSVAFVVSWFGTDLRVGACEVMPAVDNPGKATIGRTWLVAGVGRDAARVVTQIDGRAAYGGTPSDDAVIAGIADLKARGLSVVFYPFMMMDIGPANSLTDPWTGAASQPVFPWRGRITCSPAPGQPGSPDGTATAAAQVAAFFGTVQAGDYAVSGSTVSYSGPDEWSFSRLTLHYAALCKAAGGVDAFIIGSEMVGVTRIRSASGVYPAVAHLKTLAGQVRALLGPSVRIGYAADWTEYGAHVRDGGDEVRFPLDPLWSDANIDFIGVDYYPPVADWRDGAAHLDASDWPDGPSMAYLKARLGSGEAYDWYYASPADRAAQIRTPITDGAYGKPWIHRAKDLKGWWSNPHVERVGGSETAATGWTAQSKPIWLTEIGCPAVDKGANSPNLFPDPKSDESGYPPFSSATRDDLVQARLLEAIIARFDHTHPDFSGADNPVSPLYGGRMVDAARIHVWAWDARPFPAFPALDSVWGDGPNWLTGHWLNGRIEGMPVARLIEQICADYDLDAPAMRGVDGFVDGYVIDRPMSARAALEPVLGLFSLKAAASGNGVTVFGAARSIERVLTRDDLVADKSGDEISLTRGQETELPASLAFGFADGDSQYRPAVAASRRLETVSRREETTETTAVMTRAEAQRRVDIVLQDAWVARETARFALRPGLVAVEPGDLVTLDVRGMARTFEITRITDGAMLACEARAIEPAVFDSRPARLSVKPSRPPKIPGRPLAMVIDLPADPGAPTPLAWLAVRAEPWGGPYTLWRQVPGSGYRAEGAIGRSALLGETETTLPPGRLWRWNRSQNLTVEIFSGALAATDDEGALAGQGLLALEGPGGIWEIVSFRDAELIGPNRYRLGQLLRGLQGSEAAAQRVLAPGARVIVLDGALYPLFTGGGDFGGSARFRLSPAGRDHADPAAVEVVAAAGRAAVLPPAPVHVRAVRGPAGVLLTWLRRARRDGDSWDIADVPLVEDSEAYQVEILDGATVVRTVSAGAPALVYPAADEIADFGGPLADLRLKITQISRIAGPGHGMAATVPVLRPL